MMLSTLLYCFQQAFVFLSNYMSGGSSESEVGWIKFGLDKIVNFFGGSQNMVGMLSGLMFGVTLLLQFFQLVFKMLSRGGNLPKQFQGQDGRKHEIVN